MCFLGLAAAGVVSFIGPDALADPAPAKVQPAPVEIIRQDPAMAPATTWSVSVKDGKSTLQIGAVSASRLSSS